MSRKWGTLVFLLLAMPIMALAQSTGKLSGRVLDASTNEPLPGANVLLEGTQLGTITDVDGNYFIIGVPVGSYNVQASFVGYQSQTVQSVEINAGYTRELNFSLAPGVELGEVVVAYERPLIQRDAIGTPRVVTAEDITNLPVRGAANLAALQGGVVANEGSSSLFIRGGREQEVDYYVDGVKVVGAVAVPQQAIEEQEMLIGTIPARYGDAMSGVISITTKSGGTAQKFFGSVEAISSEVLDPFGYNLASLTLGGPLVPKVASFFVSAEGNWMSDDDPYARSVYELPDDVFNSLVNNPMEIGITDAQGDVRYVPFPGEIGAGATTNDLLAALRAQGLGDIDTTGGLHLASNTPRFRAPYLTADDFELSTTKRSPAQDLSFNGNVTLTPTQSINLRIGGAFNQNQQDTYNYQRSLYARNRYYETENRTMRIFGNWRQYLSSATFYEVGVSYSDYKFYQNPNGFSNDVNDVLFYGDVDGLMFTRDGNGAITDTLTTPGYDYNRTARAYYQYVNGKYQPQYRDGDLPGAEAIYGLFANPGPGLTLYSKQHDTQFRLNASATTQIGMHQIEFGGEYEQRTNRSYTLRALGLARYFNDGNIESYALSGTGPGADTLEINQFSDLPAHLIDPLMRPDGLAYGYDLWGNEVDDDDLAGYYRYIMGKPGEVSANAFNIAPHNPIYYAGYISDKIEFRDLVLNLGVRVDVFDNNTRVLRDPYAAVPIVRAGGLEARPTGVGEDYAVYFRDGNASNEIVGYRDTDGNFYDPDGQRVDYRNVTDIGKPASLQVETGKEAEAFLALFEDYKPQVTFMPRIGVSFPVTDQALFFASYNVLTQRPSEEAFLSAQQYVNLGNEYIANPNLKPETTTQYELGFRQRLGARAALQLSGFYRTQNNKIQIRSMNTAVPAHISYFNVDFTTTKGATVEFDLRRTNNVAINANYTLQFAQASGSDSESMQQIAWRGNYFPNFISAADFDRRHTFNLSIDYRNGAGEGPMLLGARLLENLGVNLLASVKSGMPYTRFKTPIIVPVYEDRVPDIGGAINSVYLPWTALVDLRIDRQFNFGPASLTAFLWVQNLLDSDNILGGFRGTGLPNDDGYLNSEAGQAALSNATPDAESFRFHYQTFLSNPAGLADAPFAGTRAWGLPRRTRLGIRLNF